MWRIPRIASRALKRTVSTPPASKPVESATQKPATPGSVPQASTNPGFKSSTPLGVKPVPPVSSTATATKPTTSAPTSSAASSASSASATTAKAAGPKIDTELPPQRRSVFFPLLAVAVGTGAAFLAYQEYQQPGYSKQLWDDTSAEVEKQVDKVKDMLPPFLGGSKPAESDVPRSPIEPETSSKPAAHNEQAAAVPATTVYDSDTGAGVSEPPSTTATATATTATAPQEEEVLPEPYATRLAALRSEYEHKLAALQHAIDERVHPDTAIAALNRQEELARADMRQALARQAERLAKDLRTEYETKLLQLQRAADERLRQTLSESTQQLQSELGQAYALIEKMRDAVAALSTVREMRENFAMQSAAAHKLSMAAMAMERALVGRTNFTTELSLLKSAAAASGSIIAASAAAAIPETVATSGVASVYELQERFARVSDAVREAALIPNNGGFGWHALARLISRLQFREENPPAETAAKMSDAEKRVMRAQSALTSGDILTAVTELDSLTGLAAKVALDWVNDAKTHLRVRLAIDAAGAEAAVTAATFSR